MELPDKFPWMGLFEIMAKQGFIFKNYPNEVPLPNALPKKGKSKGIGNLVKVAKLQLINCLDDAERPMHFSECSSEGASNRCILINILMSCLYRYHIWQGSNPDIPLGKDRPSAPPKSKHKPAKSPHFIVGSDKEENTEYTNKECKLWEQREKRKWLQKRQILNS